MGRCARGGLLIEPWVAGDGVRLCGRLRAVSRRRAAAGSCAVGARRPGTPALSRLQSMKVPAAASGTTGQHSLLRQVARRPGVFSGDDLEDGLGGFRRLTASEFLAPHRYHAVGLEETVAPITPHSGGHGGIATSSSLVLAGEHQYVGVPARRGNHKTGTVLAAALLFEGDRCPPDFSRSGSGHPSDRGAPPPFGNTVRT